MATWAHEAAADVGGALEEMAAAGRGTVAAGAIAPGGPPMR
ncbi:hypothetical protein [Nocardiopsis sp. CNT-189]